MWTPTPSCHSLAKQQGPSSMPRAIRAQLTRRWVAPLWCQYDLVGVIARQSTRNHQETPKSHQKGPEQLVCYSGTPQNNSPSFLIERNFSTHMGFVLGSTCSTKNGPKLRSQRTLSGSVLLAPCGRDPWYPRSKGSSTKGPNRAKNAVNCPNYLDNTTLSQRRHVETTFLA